MTQIDLPIIRTSERRDFKRCPQRWWWAWREGLRPKTESFGPLWFGTGIHLALEKHYVLGTERGEDPIKTWREYVGTQVDWIKTIVEQGETREDTITQWVEAGELGEAMLKGYLEEYGLDEDWEVLAVELPFQVSIPKPGTKTALVVYAGTFDLVARQISTGKVFLWDHKTAKSITLGHLPLDDQAGAYWALATHVLRKQGILGPKERIHGILYNFLMKSLPDDRPRNADGKVCNQPKKEHYVEALREQYLDMGLDVDAEIPGLGKTLEKASLAQLKAVAEEEFKLEVFGEVSAKQPAKRFHREMVLRTTREMKSQVQRIGSEAAVMEMYRDGTLPLIKNPTKDCQWDCTYRELCGLHENGADVDEYIDLVFKQEDPYAAHRPQDEEE